MTTRTHGTILQNVLSGLTVSFVALSLGAAFGILSGRGAFAGMLSAAVIATITSLLGGTRIQCSGPTGPMTTVTALVVAAAHDQLARELPGLNPDHFINITLFLTAGLLTLSAVLRLGKFITYVPNVVISGFMNGIAVIIWLDQLKKLFGFGGKAAFSGDMAVNIAVAACSCAAVFLLPRLIRRRLPALASLLSGTLLTLVLVTAACVLLGLDIERVQLTGTLSSWADVTGLLRAQWPADWSLPILLAALPFAAQLTVLGYLDTLLTSLVIDKMTGERTAQNRELFAQGASIAAVGALGGIPGAQATIRSVLIVKEGATLRLAGVLVGVFCLLEMILLQDMINLIPQAVFSGILLKVGYDVFDWLPLRLYLKELASDWHHLVHRFFSRHDDERIYVTNTEMLLIAGTTLVTIFWDLNLAVGAFTALFYVFHKLLGWRMRDLRAVTETEGITDEP